MFIDLICLKILLCFWISWIVNLDHKRNKEKCINKWSIYIIPFNSDALPIFSVFIYLSNALTAINTIMHPSTDIPMAIKISFVDKFCKLGTPCPNALEESAASTLECVVSSDWYNGSVVVCNCTCCAYAAIPLLGVEARGSRLSMKIKPTDKSLCKESTLWINWFVDDFGYKFFCIHDEITKIIIHILKYKFYFV